MRLASEIFIENLALDVPVQQLFHDNQEEYASSALDSKEELRKLIHRLVDKGFEM